MCVFLAQCYPQYDAQINMTHDAGEKGGSCLMQCDRFQQSDDQSEQGEVVVNETRKQVHFTEPGRKKSSLRSLLPHEPMKTDVLGN